MAQITIYVPDKLFEQLKRKIKGLHKSMSAYFTDLVKKELRPSQWPKPFVDLYGCDPNFPTVEDLPHKEPNPL